MAVQTGTQAYFTQSKTRTSPQSSGVWQAGVPQAGSAGSHPASGVFAGGVTGSLLQPASASASVTTNDDRFRVAHIPVLLEFRLLVRP